MYLLLIALGSACSLFLDDLWGPLAPGAFLAWGWVGAVGGALAGGWMAGRAQSNANQANLQATRETNEAQKAIAEQTNAFNARQAQQQMDFQREMSGTSYQRSMADMKKAGLNPMLAFSQGGASTPSGAMAQGQQAQLQAPKFQAEDAMGKTVASTAVEAARIHREFKALESQTDLNNAIKETQKAQTKLNENNAKVALANEKIMNTELPAIRAKSEYEKKRNEIDAKMAVPDAITRRTREYSGIISNAVDIFKPRIFGSGRMNDGDMIVDRNGEIKYEKPYRRHIP